MPEFEKDPSGQASCRNRVVCNDDPWSKDDCAKFKRYCRYSEDCRVPIPVKEGIKVEIPPRDWLLARLGATGGIAPEYGIAMLDRIEQLERDLGVANETSNRT
jgi:hypothetical protein